MMAINFHHGYVHSRINLTLYILFLSKVLQHINKPQVGRSIHDEVFQYSRMNDMLLLRMYNIKQSFMNDPVTYITY